jgi:hypothetical protein
LRSCNRLRAPRKRPVPLKCLRVLALGLPLMLTSVLCAQQPEAAGPPIPSQPPHHSHRRVTLEDRVKALAGNLNLDQAQQDAVLKILQGRMEESLRIRSDTSISGGARIEQFRTLQDNTVYQVRAVLNEEQKKKYDPLVLRKREPAADQKTVEDWLELTTPK